METWRKVGVTIFIHPTTHRLPVYGLVKIRDILTWMKFTKSAKAKNMSDGVKHGCSYEW
jgi:hypothetical protein